jgi:hypothetical protein
VLNELTSTCNDVIVHRNRRTPERSNDPRSAPRGFRIDHIVQIFEIQMNREHMEPKCCPPMGDGSAPVRVRRRTPSNVRVRLGAREARRHCAPATAASRSRRNYPWELHCMLRTMESDLHGPITVPVVVRDGARSCFARVRGSRSWSHKSQVGQFNPEFNVHFCYRVCGAPFDSVTLGACLCGLWSVRWTLECGLPRTWSNKRRCNVLMTLSPLLDLT